MIELKEARFCFQIQVKLVWQRRHHKVVGILKIKSVAHGSQANHTIQLERATD